MSLPRLRLERCTNLGEDLWRIDEEQAHHLQKVLRLPCGEEVEGLLHGERWRMRLEQTGKNLLARKMFLLPEKGRLPRIVLLASLLKGGDFELLLRGATETGVSEIWPIEASRSVPRFTEGEVPRKMARWGKILEESTRQCGATEIPRIFPPVPLEKAVERGLPALRVAGLLGEGTVPLGAVSPACEVAVAIGPEGDWDECEKEILQRAGFCPVSLGPLVLKAFTAAIVACSYLALAWEGRIHGESCGDKVPDQGPGVQD